eukprot:COSAG05_NODE_2178_length_3433_cov_77.463707_3_plen_43_part_00
MEGVHVAAANTMGKRKGWRRLLDELSIKWTRNISLFSFRNQQ